MAKRKATKRTQRRVRGGSQGVRTSPDTPIPGQIPANPPFVTLIFPDNTVVVHTARGKIWE